MPLGRLTWVPCVVMEPLAPLPGLRWWMIPGSKYPPGLRENPFWLLKFPKAEFLNVRGEFLGLQAELMNSFAELTDSHARPVSAETAAETSGIDRCRRGTRRARSAEVGASLRWRAAFDTGAGTAWGSQCRARRVARKAGTGRGRLEREAYRLARAAGGVARVRAGRARACAGRNRAGLDFHSIGDGLRPGADRRDVGGPRAEQHVVGAAGREGGRDVPAQDMGRTCRRRGHKGGRGPKDVIHQQKHGTGPVCATSRLERQLRQRRTPFRIPQQGRKSVRVLLEMRLPDQIAVAVVDVADG